MRIRARAGWALWVGLLKVSAGLGQKVRWSGSAAGLAPGKYQFDLPLQATGGTILPASVHFELLVDALLPQGPRLDVSASAGGQPLTVPFRVGAKFGLPFQAKSDQPRLTIANGG